MAALRPSLSADDGDAGAGAIPAKLQEQGWIGGDLESLQKVEIGLESEIFLSARERVLAAFP
jgi:hypothetical protein